MFLLAMMGINYCHVRHRDALKGTLKVSVFLLVGCRLAYWSLLWALRAFLILSSPRLSWTSCSFEATDSSTIDPLFIPQAVQGGGSVVHVGA
jgi:hypothetical protein